MRRSGSWRAKFEGLEAGFREEKSVCEQGRKTKEGRETGEADAGREKGPVDAEWEEKGVRTGMGGKGSENAEEKQNSADGRQEKPR